ncbi:MAG: 16S rRNA (guanine(966)-N(2))-methyltransferase RsmD [Robiginitomaculum sp.]|nr:MAG: 16S rRNA (guanine(966)-N(2))-methyltransferase RsmD [Robiginitomaculum sp.]
MRIVGGKNRGRNIIAPSGKNTRPTSDQARESIFNILKHAEWSPPMDGAVVIDIFAGSGALGLEALSRGAEFCLFVETEPKARASIRENTVAMGLGGMTRLHRRDATKLRVEPNNLRGPFSHIFLDPPYNKNLARPVLRKLNEQGLIAENAVIIYEMAKDEEPNLRGYAIHDTRVWGAAKVVFMSLEKT